MAFLSSINSDQKPSGASDQQLAASGSPTPNPVSRYNPLLSLNINSLYILLSDQEEVDKWHWAFYLHRGLSDGWVSHVTRPTGFWFYDHRTSDSVIYTDTIVAALEIAVIEPLMHDALRDRIAQVPLEDTKRFGGLTCRTWLLRAVEELNNEGYISLFPGITAEIIEQEAKDAALMSTDRDRQRAVRSQYWRD